MNRPSATAILWTAIFCAAGSNSVRGDTLGSGANAIDIEFVTIGNPGNAPDTRYDATGYGSVSYVYRIGEYEVTAGQYTKFLNAVAKDDPNELYDTFMGGDRFHFGTIIKRNGSSPNYTYSTDPEWADRPVNFVSFWDAARFANWLHNGT